MPHLSEWGMANDGVLTGHSSALTSGSPSRPPACQNVNADGWMA